MRMVTLFLFGLCCALLAACASTPAVLDGVPPAKPSGDRVARYDWLAERDRVASRLGAVGSIEIRTRDDGALLLRLPAAEGFSRDSAEPTAALRTLLEQVAPALIEADRSEIRVIGHTDSIGSEIYNLRLSIRRAEAVMEVLRTLGVPLASLSADGKGEAEPIANNRTAGGRAINRRVEILIHPL